MKKLFLTKDRFLKCFFLFLGILIVSLFTCLLVLQYISRLQIKSDDERYESYLLADELRQSSDDLTKMVRMYVITGDTKYRDYFYDILDIRNGIIPRPKQYNQIYWDLVETNPVDLRPGTEKEPLKQRLIQHGFTLSEYALLEKSEHESDDLADLEIEAINAMVGKFSNGAGKYTVQGAPNPELAKKIVFGEAYMEQKRKIMLPLQQFFESVELRTTKRTEALHRQVVLVISIAIVLSALSVVVMLISIFRALSSLAKVTSDNELLLLNVLPSPIADRLKQGEEPIADEIPQASVLFADIVGFTNATVQFGAGKMVQLLNQLFDEFDALSEKHGVEKVKTIGDNYMAVSGLPVQVPDHATRLANFALEILDKIKEFNETHQVHFDVRIGMTYGTVIAGVIGHKKFIYDVWGDVVNIASRMESTGEAGKIQITDKMAIMLADQFDVEERSEIEVKGIGKMKTFFLLRKKVHSEPPQQQL